MRSHTLILGLNVPPEQSRLRVSQRVEQIVKQGLKKEGKELARRYNWDIEPMKGIGYREFKDYFEGSQTLEQTKDRIISSSMQHLAKRQRAWLKRNKSIHWLQNPDQAAGLVQKFLSK